MSAPMSLSSSYLFSHANTPQHRNIGYLFISIGLASVLLAKLTSNMENCYLLTCSEKTRKYFIDLLNLTRKYSQAPGPWHLPPGQG